MRPVISISRATKILFQHHFNKSNEPLNAMLLKQLREFQALQGKRLLAFSMFSCGFALNEPF